MIDGGQGSGIMGNFRERKTKDKSKTNRFEENPLRKLKKFYQVQEDTAKIKGLFSGRYSTFPLNKNLVPRFEELYKILLVWFYSHFKTFSKHFLENTMVLGTHKDQHTTRFFPKLVVSRACHFYQTRCIYMNAMEGAYTNSQQELSTGL